MNRDFHYELRKILKAPPVAIPNNPTGKIFRYDYSSQELADGVILQVESETVADVDGLKVFTSKSEYFIPYEQPTAGMLSNEILTELIYQHISRETDMIFAVSSGKVVLQPPTLKTILDSLVQGDN